MNEPTDLDLFHQPHIKEFFAEGERRYMDAMGDTLHKAANGTQILREQFPIKSVSRGTLDTVCLTISNPALGRCIVGVANLHDPEDRSWIVIDGTHPLAHVACALGETIRSMGQDEKAPFALGLLD